MKARLKRILPFIGYGLFYFVAFFFACYLTFPYARLRDRIIAEFAAEQKGQPGQRRLEIEELEPYWFTGVRARGVRLTMAAAPKPVDPNPEPPTVLDIEEVRWRVGIFARLIGRTKVSFFMRAFGGEIEGNFVDTAVDRHIDMEMHDVSASRIEPLAAMIGLPMYGALNGTIDLTFPEKRASKADGIINLKIIDLALGDGKTKIKGTLALPKMNVGNLAFEAEAKAGLLKINKLAATGTDLELVADGKISLKDTPPDSAADMNLRFKFTDAYRGRNDTTKSLLGAPGSTAPALFEMADPNIKNAKRADGFYGWHIVGLLSAPRFEPASGALTSPVRGGGVLRPTPQ